MKSYEKHLLKKVQLEEELTRKKSKKKQIDDIKNQRMRRNI